MLKKIRRALLNSAYFAIAYFGFYEGVEYAVNVFVFWMVLRLPIFFDQLLIKSEKAISGEAIVCIAGGMAGNNLPSEAGWHRIYTAVQLYFDGYAPKIIFTGGGTAKTTEAEVYAEVAQWLGCPEEAMIFDPNPHSTAEHPLNILKNEHSTSIQ